MTASSTQVGGRPELTRTSLLVSAAEWAELSRPGPELHGFLRDHIQLPGLNWHQVSLERTADPALVPFIESLDLMGDGSLILPPDARAHRRLSVAAGPAAQQAGTAADRGSHLRRRTPAARPASRRPGSDEAYLSSRLCALRTDGQ
jgi:hypothetical protein